MPLFIYRPKPYEDILACKSAGADSLNQRAKQEATRVNYSCSCDWRIKQGRLDKCWTDHNATGILEINSKYRSRRL